MDPVGNTYDKYSSRRPVERRLVARWIATLHTLLDRAGPRSILDYGCGEGVLTERWSAERPGVPVLGVDRPDREVREHWRRREGASLEFRALLDETPPPGRWDLVAAIEVLEHVVDPEETLAALADRAERWLLLSVPREPVWRALNVARGAYWRRLGNTPGHRHGWSRRRFEQLARQAGEVVETAAPLPWSVALVDVGRPEAPEG